MDKNHITPEQRDSALSYEPPKIEDYGTLAEVTAGFGGDKTDFFGNQLPGGGKGSGYS
jgi:hypothetical protein